MQSFQPVVHCVRNQSSIEGCQLTTMRDGKSEEITVSNLSRCQKSRDIDMPWIEQTDIIRPKDMP